MAISRRSSLPRRASRLASAAVLATTLAVAFSGVVAADSVTGTTGHFIPTDLPSTPGAVCRYAMVDPANAQIYQIVVKPPSVWWPNRSSSSTTEHGRVGWRAIVRYMPSSTWIVYRRSAIQYRTAYEDQTNPYGSSTKAPFANIAVNIGSGALSSAALRVTVKAYWFRSDGSVLGTATHAVKWYRLRVGTTNNGTVDTECPTWLGETP